MRKIVLCLAALLLSSCGDDLGWDQKVNTKDADCYDATEPVDSGVCNLCQDVTEVDVESDTSAIPEDVTVADSNRGGSDSGNSDTDDVSIDSYVPDAQGDVTETGDAGSDAEEVVNPPECVTATDCAAVSLPCVAPDCQAGKCVIVTANTPCSDDNECTAGDMCQLDKCVPGIALNCDDLNPCTDDSCDPTKGCVSLANSATCTDGNSCTLDDVCSSSQCVGKPAICDDGELCTADACDPATGCVNLANSATCTDGNECTLDDKCAEGKCKSGELKVCPQPVCTVSSCEAGLCVTDLTLLNDTDCDDENPCTTLSKCLDASCLAVINKNCDDANICTLDSCDPKSSCVNEPVNLIPCDDGNACTESDVCKSGSCNAGLEKVCNDNSVCTNDSCDPVKGCVFSAVADGTSCVVGICQVGICSCPSGFGCAAPKFSYTNDSDAGMIGGMGGGVGPKMGCADTDVLIGLGFDFSNGTKTATRTTAVCGVVNVAPDGTVSTTQTSKQESGGSGCFGWDPSVQTPLTICPSGWAVVGLKALKPGGTLFNSVTVVCGKLGTGGKWTGEKQDLVVPGMPGTGDPQEITCPPESIARYFETRAGCGQDALTMYCAVPTSNCDGQDLICKDVL